MTMRQLPQVSIKLEAVLTPRPLDPKAKGLKAALIASMPS